MTSPLLLRVAPILFVFLWSTGWLVAKYAAPHADPLTFLSVRFGLAALAMAGVVLATAAPRALSGRQAAHGLASGVMLHAVYLGAVWWAIAQGVPAGISALIAALQPLLTALAAPALLGERLSNRQKLGIGLGFVGLVLALAPKLMAVEMAQLRAVAVPIGVNLAGMVAVTAATFHQKRFLAGGDLRVISTLQYVGAFLIVLPAAWLFEPMRFDINPASIAAMAWSVIALSVGAIGLFLMLIRRGEVSRAAALIYLIPPTAAVESYLMFGETLNPVQITGLCLTVAGVWLASRAG